jgi:hypothetical protein
MIDDQGELTLEDDIIEYVEMARDSRISGDTFVRNMVLIVGGKDWEEVARDVLKEKPELLKVFESYVDEAPTQAN